MRQLFRFDPVLGYRFVPGLRARVPHEDGGYPIRTNALGFRSDHEFVGEPKPGMRRVLLFGDSFTAGDGVPNAERFGDRLSNLMQGVEIYNLGLPATGTDQQYLCWREFGREISHDLLVIAVLIDNIRRIKPTYTPLIDESGTFCAYAKPRFELGPDGLSLRGVPVPRFPFGASALSPETSAGLRQIKHYGRLAPSPAPLPEYDDADDPSWLLMRAILTLWIAQSRRPVLIVPLPLHDFVEGEADPSAYRARFSELSEATGCLLHDPLPELRRYPPETRRGFRFPRDIHPTPAGHRALAASIRPAIERVLAGTGDAG
ncbi:SGNH/GDSL hydrolase family protein [Methylobacterium sp. sgz302541]|uniref:SGNH/GDSL hydrolase family protein n=1 Tax=unclassified Methylobacterium TaxID=2615210 RepID=UPI003D334AED